jgi:serine/threonine protein phosphatase 1
MSLTEGWSRVAISAERLWLRVADLFSDGLARLAPATKKRTSETAVSQPAPSAAVIPDGRRVYAVGDIHGRADLLQRLLDTIATDAANGGFTGRPVLIFLGDYVDRGFQSRDVIEILLKNKLISAFDAHFLKGNHEAAMLNFLSNPDFGPRWAEFGGVETLVSYGVRPPRSRTGSDEWVRASRELGERLPPEHRQFLESLAPSVRIGGYAFVHAGVRPGVPIAQQSEQDLLWIRETFLKDRRPLEAVIVHGHTPVSVPYRDDRRIAVDTGAYLSGRLTAVRLEGDRVDFIMTAPLAGRAGGDAA